MTGVSATYFSADVDVHESMTGIQMQESSCTMKTNNICMLSGRTGKVQVVQALSWLD